jgi:cbb3-type cytochrome oxidase maturation protein
LILIIKSKSQLGYFWQPKLSSLSALIILIGVSIAVAAGFLVAFLWSAKSGQYDDDYTPSVRMLFDDMPKTIEVKEEKKSTTK